MVKCRTDNKDIAISQITSQIISQKNLERSYCEAQGLTVNALSEVEEEPRVKVHSGGSRISLGRGRQLSGGGPPTYDFAKFSQKLHEIELKEFGPLGGGRPNFYYVDPPLVHTFVWLTNTYSFGIQEVFLWIYASRERHVSSKYWKTENISQKCHLLSLSVHCEPFKQW